MEEDTDAKIRRNIVVASGLIVLLAWLDLSLPGVTTKLLEGQSQLPLSPFRLWVACFAILVYLALRYRFSSEWIAFDRTLVVPASALRNQYVQKLLQQQLHKYHRTGSNPSIFFYKLKEAAERQTEEMRKNSDRTDLPRPRITIDIFNPGREIWEGDVQVAMTWVTGASRMANSGERILYAVGGWRRWWIEAKSYTIVAIYSETSVRHLVPVALCISAFAIVGRQIWRAC
jgi:hypothetical protein